MKFVHKLSLYAACFVVAASCVPRSFLERLDSLEDKVKDQQTLLEQYQQRLQTLELLCGQINTNVTGIQTIIQGLSNNLSIVSVTPVMNDGVEIGFVIRFSDDSSTTIYHGTNGKDGVDGKDGKTPSIGVKADKDGEMYWTIDGEWLLDASGNKVAVSKSVAPKFKIDEGDWYVSFDNGKTWDEIDVIGEEEDSDDFFSSVTYDNKNLYLTLADGTVITIPLSKVEEAEEEEDMPVVPGGMALRLAYSPLSEPGTKSATTGMLELAKVAPSLTIKAADGKYEDWAPSGDNRPEKVTFDVKFYNKSKAQIKNIPAGLVDAVYVEVSTEDISQFYDGKTYVQTLKTYNKMNGLVQTITLHVTKVMPTKADLVEFRPMQEVVEGSGLFRAYMIPNLNPNASSLEAQQAQYQVGPEPSLYGSKDLGNIFYDLSSKIEFRIVNAAYNEKTEDYTDDIIVKCAGSATSGNLFPLSVENELIDNETVHKVIVSYNFGRISNDASVDKNGKPVGPRDYVLESEQDLSVIFSCWHYAASLDWRVEKDKNGKVTKDTKPQPKWSAEAAGDEAAMSDIIVTSSYNNDFFGDLTLDEIINDLDWLKLSENKAGNTIELVYERTGKKDQVNPYFVPSIEGATIVFTQINTQSDSAPVQDHEETLKIYVEDAFGHVSAISTSVTVKAPGKAN